jgi:hypothetical protein
VLNVNVSTLVFSKGDTERSLPQVTLKLVSQRITVRQIIQQAVEQQLKTMLADKQAYASIRQNFNAQYLEQGEIELQQSRGKIALEKPAADELPSLELEVRRALQGFERKYFKIFVDDNEVLNPNDECTLVDGATIKFVRLIPLAGG